MTLPLFSSLSPRRPVTVKVKKLSHFRGELPEYKSLLSAGFDVRARLETPAVLKPGERALIPTGLCFEIPPGFELQARPRSGLALKHGITLLNTPGTIDADYRGEIKILIVNGGLETVTLRDQERLAQLALCRVFQARFEESASLTETARGEGGFGSTGV